MTAQQRRPDSRATVGRAIELAKPTVLNSLLEAYEADLSAVMPKHVNPETFIGLAMSYVRRDEFLSKAAAANPLSLILALREIAAWGHVPQRGTAALVAYKSSKDGDNGWRVQAIEEVGGTIQRIYRAGGVTALHCDVMRDNDPVARFQRTTMALPLHQYDEFADPASRGPLKAVYAWADLTTGGVSDVVFLNRFQVAKYRNLSKAGEAFWGPPWPAEGPWTVEMWKKTALHRLAKVIPTSAEYRWQVDASMAAAQRGKFEAAPPVHEEPADWIDGESEDGWPETAQPPTTVQSGGK